MLKRVVLMLKGAAFGLSNIVPGMTGGAVLIILGIYEQFVDAVGNLATDRERRREYILFLATLGIGAAVAMVAFARAVTWLLDLRPALILFFFKGLLLGTVPSLLKLNSEMRLTALRVVAALIGVAVVVAFKALERYGLSASLTAEPRSLPGMAYLFAVAFAAGGANITPGISGAYLFLLGGTYGPIMEALSALGRLTIRWEIILPTGLGAALGIIAFAKLIDTALKRAPAVTGYAILGLVLGSVYGLWPSEGVSEHPLLLALCLVAGLAVPLLMGRRVTDGAPSPRSRAGLQPEAERDATA